MFYASDYDAREKEMFEKISKAKMKMMLSSDKPALIFYSAFIASFDVGEYTDEHRATLPNTMAVNAADRKMIFCPEFVERLPIDHLIEVLCHEAEHVIRMTQARRDARDPRLWGIVHDALINHGLAGQGLGVFLSEFGITLEKLVAHGYIDTVEGWAAETLYERLLEALDGEGEGEGDGLASMVQQHLAEHDDVLDSGDMTEAQRRDIESAIEQASQMAESVAAGSTPQHIKLMLGEMKDGKLSWQQLLAHNLQQVMGAGDWSHQVPDRRALAFDQVWPSEVSMKVGELIVALDTSGSVVCDEVLLSDFVSEIKHVCAQTHPEKITILYCDAAVSAVDEYTDPSGMDVTLDNIQGGGGTSFDPPFDWVADKQRSPQCFIYLTDGYGSVSPASDPGVPTLWVVPTASPFVPPFGTLININ
jgi:predicted metal-dependent peptidase